MDEPQRPDTKLGVSTFLPPLAAAVLVRAAGVARKYSGEDLERVRTIDRAIEEVQRRWPEFFKAKATGRVQATTAPFV